MFDNLPNLRALRAFEASARCGSFSLAGAELSLSPGAVGYQVKQLEAQIGVALFYRSVRRIDLTPAGQRLYQLVSRQLRELADEIRMISPGQGAHVLTIAVSTYFVTRWLSQRMGQFLNQYPDITLRLQHSVNSPDFALESVDAAIRWSDGRWPGYCVERLMDSPMMALCAPEVAAGVCGNPDPDNLKGLVFLRDQATMDRWPDWFRMAGLEDRWSTTGPVIEDPNVRVQSAIDGQGMVLANRLVEDEITRGRLVEPFPVRLQDSGYDFVYPEGAAQRVPFRQFRDWLLNQAGGANTDQTIR